MSRPSSSWSSRHSCTGWPSSGTAGYGGRPRIACSEDVQPLVPAEAELHRDRTARLYDVQRRRVVDRLEEPGEVVLPQRRDPVVGGKEGVHGEDGAVGRVVVVAVHAVPATVR